MIIKKIIEDDTKCIVNNIKYNSYYDYKVDDINILIYNLSKSLLIFYIFNTFLNIIIANIVVITFLLLLLLF